MFIYQVLPRLWGKGKFSDWNDDSFDYVKSLGITHIWFTGIPRHATGAPFVKGDPGSPYSVKDWFDTNPYLADKPEDRISEFESLVSRTHAAGLKVITDFIPNHVSPDYNGDIPRFDWCDYDWADTRKVDWSDPATGAYMLEVLRFWASKGVDGFRCDMVELVPLQALSTLFSAIRKEFPELVFIGEVYNTDNYRPFVQAGFDLLYDKSGLYDAMQLVLSGSPVSLLTQNWQRLQDLQSRMLNFLENHDEIRMQRPDFASLAFAAAFNKASFMLYFGEELGENASQESNRRTSIFDLRQPSCIKRLCSDIRQETSLTEEEASILRRHRELLSAASQVHDWSNYDLCWCNAPGPFPFLRYSNGSCILFVCNFSDNQINTTISIPEDARRLCGTQEEAIPVRVEPHDCCMISC